MALLADLKRAEGEESRTSIGEKMTISQNMPRRISRAMMTISHVATVGQPKEPPSAPPPEQAPQEQSLPRLALVPVLAIAGAIAALTAAFGGQYGYFRDELYYLVAGQHLAWGYPDQPPFVPLVARLMSDLAPGSLVVLRLPTALAGGALVLLTALLARELRGGRAAQLLACAVVALAPLGIVFTLGTEGFDLLFSVLLCWLLIRILRTGEQRLWLVAGLAAGVGLLDSDLIAFLIVAFVAGLAVAGPRRPLRSGWFYAGGAIALAMWSPYLAWQASHGWPEFAVAHTIATGGSGSSAPWWEILPGQLNEVPIWFAPIWVSGLVRLLRDRELRPYRVVGIAFGVLAVVFMATGGKPYYLSVMLPVLLAAGAEPTVNWIGRAQHRLRRGLLVAGLVLSAGLLPTNLPMLPVSVLRHTPFAGSAGEMIGWPAYVQEIARAYHSLPAAEQASAALVASNYGEAGAVDRFGAAYGLPAAYSSETGFWYWGPPPASKTVAVIIGATRAQLTQLGICGSLQLTATLDNHVGISNAEQGKQVWICAPLRESWAVIWSRVRYL
jgi:4-amino-4-deoxy-L-arabinose transferase-like glycosyltransferase